MNGNEQYGAEHKRKKSQKKTGRKIWIAIFLLLPSIIALFSFFVIYNNLHFSRSDMYDITLYDAEGNILGSESNFLGDAQKDGLVSLFSPITESISTPESIPEHILSADKFHAVVKYMNMVSKYDFYFSFEDVEGYCVYNGNGYKVGESDVQKFLSSKFAESLYENATPPVMYSISGDIVEPKYVNWNYKTLNGQYNSTNSYNVTDDILTYDMSSAIGVSFSSEPDRCNIKVYKDGSLVFSGPSSNVFSLTVQKGEMMQLEVDAQWFYSSSSSFYGSIQYEFEVTISDRAEFHLTGDNFAIESFCGIFCTNVKDVSKIVFSSDPPLPVTPKFEMSRENAVAFLPIVSYTPLGEYNITLKYGATTQSFVINVKKNDEGIFVECSADEILLLSARSNETTRKMRELKSFAAETSKGEKLFYGKFLDYTDSDIGARQYSSFGDIYINPKREYFCEGSEYRFERSGGVSVGALNSGKVIKTGYNDYIGNFVIVSHGCGLSTWYAHLSTIDVAEGDYVVRKESIGKTGLSGLSSVENVMIFVTLESEFIDPRYLCGKQFD